MLRLPEKPAGTIIRHREEPDGITLYWQPAPRGSLRYLFVGFLIIWLCGWAAGEFFALSEVIAPSDEAETREPQPFLLVWLAMWTLGGCMAIWFLYRLAKPARPESVLLGYKSFQYDPGDAFLASLANPWAAMARADCPSGWSGLWRRRRPVSLGKSAAGPFVLERVGQHQRLRFDLGADRIEIGRHLREPEREWLATVIEMWRSQGP